MNQQLQFDAFEPAPAIPPRMLARSADPITSHDAAARVNEFAPAQHALIVSVLKERGALTAHEVAAFCRLSAHEVGKRMNELERAGKARVVVNDKGAAVTRATPSGRKARVWWMPGTAS